MPDIVRDPYGNPLNRDKLITALRAENEKLRAALQDIITDSFSVYAIQVARAALGGKDE